MTIGKRLYAGFGLILGTLLILGVVNLIAISLQGSALDSVSTIESVRYQIMLNRLSLNNFLLSGDPRDEERVTKGMADTADALKRGQSKAGTDLRNALSQVESTEVGWAENFAKPLLSKRHQVDSGDATVSDLQIFYLQKDPASWLTKSSAVLDEAAEKIRKTSDDTSKSAQTWSNLSLMLTALLTVAALIGGTYVAWKTAREITQPLTHLITDLASDGDS